MTGGYGNSYAATVGNQAYQASLQNLNDIIPELYQMALDRYNQEGQDLLNQYGILGDRENTDYGRYRDTVSEYNTERDYLSGRYDSERNYDYGKYTDDRNFNYGKYSDDKSYAYNEHRNAIADEQWQKQFDEAMRQYNESMNFQKQQYNDSKLYTSGSSSGNSSGNPGNTDSNNSHTTSGVSNSIREKLASFKSNAAVENYLQNLEASETIDHETALKLMSEYMDINESSRDEEGNYVAKSYTDMVKSTAGWSVIDDGGINLFGIGIDANAIVEAPNGEKVRLDNLRKKLKSEGMSTSEANKFIKSLMKNLGI